ncbi:MAG: hypothetical protein FWG44_00430 [Oscillospiraceae bacterium]|nr:hypothetical protein [Oscillospiraceae bacterium]
MGKKNKGGGKNKETPSNSRPAPQQTNSANNMSEKQNTQTQSRAKGN